MIYSTRTKTEVSPSKALIDGLAKDGGLYVFKEIPLVPYKEWLDKDYHELAKTIFGLYLTDFSRKSINKIVNTAYNDDFDPFYAGLKTYHNHAYLTLYHGATFSFKDMALSALPLMIEEAKSNLRINKKTLVLTATSGDTGSAALAGYEKVKDAGVIVLYPTKGVSAFQEQQMNQYQSNQHVIYALDGNFDDCQSIIKNVFSLVDDDRYLVTSANSINIGRIIPQIVYYFYAYNNLVKEQKIKVGERINFAVPSGNFGNIYAGYIAKRMGLPIHNLIIASNQNNVLTTFFNTGVYDRKLELKKSISPSMDILVPSNLERYLFELLEKDSSKIKVIMDDLKNKGITLIPEVLDQTDFFAYFSNEEATKQTIKTTLKEEGLLIDPHTAVAKNVYMKYVEETKDNTYTCIVSTASPFKFSEDTYEAIKNEEAPFYKEAILKLSKNSNPVLDERMVDLIKEKATKIPLSKTTALSTVLEKIGELNDHN
jgi:threonine synthase